MNFLNSLISKSNSDKEKQSVEVLEHLTEMEENKSSLIHKLRIKEKLLKDKEQQLLRLEEEKKATLTKEQEWKQTEVKYQQTQKKLTNQVEELDRLNNELNDKLV